MRTRTSDSRRTGRSCRLPESTSGHRRTSGPFDGGESAFRDRLEQIRGVDALHGPARPKKHAPAKPHHRHFLRHRRASVRRGTLEQSALARCQGVGGSGVPDDEAFARLRARARAQLRRWADALRGCCRTPPPRPPHLHALWDHHRIRERPHRDAPGPGGTAEWLSRHVAQNGALRPVFRLSARPGLRGGRTARLTVALVLLVAAGCASTPPRPRADPCLAVLAGLPDVSGRYIDIGGWRGRVVVVQFLATWCFPCIAIAPRLQDLEKRYGAQGL